jgi:lipid-A-disaccharide synthase
MKYFIVAGEASGDKHAAGLVHGLRALDAAPQFVGTGGAYMKNAGVRLVRDIQDMAFMGFTEVVKNIFTIRKNFKVVQQEILDFHPDVLILVDYPGFNLRMARWAKEQGFKVIYYIAPQAWAWRESRVNTIRQYVDLLLVILPFEQKWFSERRVPAIYVGHPILEGLPHIEATEEKTRIAILPGSRKQEISTLLPLMLDALHLQPADELVVAGMSAHGEAYYNKIIKGRAQLVLDDIYGVLHQSKVALVTSGTATLETALMGVPQVVCYKSGRINYWIGKRLIKIPHISLVNIIVQRSVVPELIQGNCHPVAIKQAYMEVIDDPIQMMQGYVQLRKLLGKLEASKNAALRIFDFLSK